MTLSQIDFTDLDNSADGFPHHLFAVHGRKAPVSWHELRDPQTDSSVTGGERPYVGTLPQDPSMARLERRVRFAELLGRFTSVRPAGPVEWTRGNRRTGLRLSV